MSILKAAVAAVAIMAATPASAAVFTYTFTAVGTGSQSIGYSSTERVVQDLVGAVITIGVDIAAGDNYKPLPFDNGGGGIAASTTGLTFFDGPNVANFTSFSGRGTACFANPTGALPSTVGTVAVDPSCGNLTFRQSFAGGSGSTFTGQITGLDISAGGVASSVVTRVIAAVPESTTWALMLAGFGMVGYALRRRVRVAYA